jgi:hypothetical protein
MDVGLRLREFRRKRYPLTSARRCSRSGRGQRMQGHLETGTLRLRLGYAPLREQSDLSY